MRIICSGDRLKLDGPREIIDRLMSYPIPKELWHWLGRIGETDPNMIENVFRQCGEDPEAREAYLRDANHES